MPQRPAGMGVGLMLALLAHALLVAALAFSVRWKASEPAGIEAELWAAVPQIAAPRAAAPEPSPAPVEVKPSPPPPPPPKAEPAPTPVPDAQIAIEKARREEQKREELKREAEKREAEKREQAKREEARREEERKKAEDKREQARLDQQRAKEELDRKKKEQAAKAKQEEEKLESIRQANLERMMGQAGATGAPGSTGTAVRSAGPSAGYAGRIRARIQPNIVFADNVSGNPLATVEVRAAPDGTIVGMRLVRSSGVKAWDDAVMRAIEKTEVLPRDTDGRVPAKFEIDFRPRD